MAEKKLNPFKSMEEAIAKVARANRPLNHAVNIVGKVVEYGKKTIKVEVQNGPLKDQTIDVIPGRTKVTEFSTPSDETTASYTMVGGYIRFDSVKKVDDEEHYKANWANRFLKEAENRKGDHILADQLTRVYRQGTVTTRTGAQIPGYRMNILEASQAEVVTDRDALQQKFVTSFESHGGVLMYAKVEGEILEQSVRLPIVKDGENYRRMDAAEYAAEMVDSMDESFFELLGNGDVCIVPMRNVRLGSKVCEGIAETLKKAGNGPARFMTVNLNAYEREPLGQRLSYALAKNRDGEFQEGISQELVDRLKADFLETARPEERDALAKDGWRGVSDTALTEFFATKGVELAQPASAAWNVATIAVRPYKDNPEDFLVLKSHEKSFSARPFPVEIDFLKDARTEFYKEMGAAVVAAVAGPAKKAEAETPAKDDAKAPAAAEAGAAAPDEDLDSEGEEKSIDDMLMDLPEGEMDLG